MINLFKAEVLRHLNWILLLAIAHFLILYYLFQMGMPFTNADTAILWLFGIQIFPVIFGVLQMKLHKRSSDWTYLLHRPLQPARIHIALTLAGILLLALAVALPALLMTVVMQIDGRFGTEARHYRFLVMAAGIVMTAYALGQFAVLAPGRLGFLALTFLFAFIFQVHLKSERIITHTLLMSWSLLIAHLAFKADLKRQLRSPMKLLLMELPIVFGCYVLLAMFANIYFSLRSATDDVAYFNFADFFSREGNRAQLQLALERSEHPDAALLAQQSRLGEVIAINVPQNDSYPERQQLPLRDNIEKLRLDDPDTGTSWLFSHSTMLYLGRDSQSGARAGWLGPDGFHTDGIPAARFTSVPLAASNNYLIDDHHIYQIDWQEHTVHLRFTNYGDERLADSLFIGEKFATLFSNQRLFIFNTQKIRDPATALVPDAILDVTAPVEIPFPNFQVMPLIDGYLVLDLGVTRDIIPGALVDFVTAGKSKLRVWEVRPEEAGELIVSEVRQSPYSEAELYASFIQAPGIRILLDGFQGLKMGRSTERTFPVLHHDFPLWVIVKTLIFCSMCGALVTWLLRNSRLPGRIRCFWIGICIFSGLPGLLAFLAGHYWRGRDNLQLPLPALGAERDRPGLPQSAIG